MDKDILRELKEQTKWLRFLALPNLKKTIEENLQTKEKRKIYSLTDGKNSTYEISKKLKIEGIRASHMTIYNYWKKWSVLSLVIPSEKYSGRFEKIIDLEDLDIK
jgi:DNA-binding PadR family transcriptional regulator